MKTTRVRTANGLLSKSLFSSVSTIGLLAAVPALAQEQVDPDEVEVADQTDEVDEGDVIIVTGLRESLASSQNQKRNADTVVDVVTANDIGALPDRSVSEVLQRIPGVSIIRFAGPNDPDHFAIEGAGAVIRGLPFVRSEVNGRDGFSASPSGSIGFDDVSPELLASVAVFKNSSADLIEGGAAGTIDLRTRVPFDSTGQKIAISAELNYGDLREEASPTISALYSNEWDTGIGRLGILGNVAYSELESRANGSSFGDPRELDGQFIPAGGGIRNQDFNRERLTLAGAVQWESLDRRWIATAQFFRTDSELLWGENVLETVVDNASAPGVLDQSDFTFDNDGVFQSGTITDTAQWRGPNATGTQVGAFGPGGQQLNTYRTRFESDQTEDYSFNLKFAPTADLRFNFDAQYVTSQGRVNDLSLFGSFFAPVAIDRSVGAVPDIAFQGPAEAFNDPSSYFLRAQLDHTTQNEGDSLAFRGDVEYDFSGDGWLKSIRAGGRYNREDLTIRESDFNWGNISEVWTARDIQGQSGGDFNQIQSVLQFSGNANPEFDALLAPILGSFDFDGYQRGNVSAPSGPIPSLNGINARDFDEYQATVSNILSAVGGSPSGLNVLTERPGVIAGTPFLPSEISDLTRDNLAAYVRLDFESPVDNAGVQLSGNIGLRYVRTERSAGASITVDPFNEFFPPAQVALCAPGAGANIPNFQVPAICSLDLGALETAFGAGPEPRIVQRVVDTNYDAFLPSLNLKLDLPGDHVLRAAISRTLTRPTATQLNERVVILQEGGPNVPGPPDPVTGEPTSVPTFGRFIGNATGNAALLPQTAWNFDLAWEWYFARTGSVTVTGFYKEIDNFIAFQPVPVDLSFDGADLSIFRNTEVNTDDTGSVLGFEVAYQQFFDFLPGALSGLGVQFNYTYLDAEGVSNEIDPAFGSDDPPVARFDIDDGIFPRVSKHTINAVALYEKGPVQARLAYNWRSTFQLTERDVIFPFASIYQPSTGQLDASIFYDVTDYLKVGVQGVNLTDDITVTEQSIDPGGLRTLRNAFRNDRRFTLIARLNF
ncbi:TonB-dependent receptor [Erythrobacter longus]|uniref:TonB-dependent receptor n=1 Tax=Erythrobacter longus TaxID=1044 RepID=UPI0009E092ED|nr:TonB-dependent receptor [Erythrobacter longus]